MTQKYCAADVVRRCLEIYNFKTIDELAELLSTQTQEIQTLIDNEEYFPQSWFIFFMADKDINPIWLMSGRGVPIIKDCGGIVRSLVGGEPRILLEQFNALKK